VIQNATLTRIDTPAPSTPGGSVPMVTGSDVRVRCWMGEPTFSQRVALGEVIQDSTAVCYVPKAGYAATTPARGQRMTVAIDGGAAVSYHVVHVKDWTKAGGLSYWECFLRTE
jgi:hypothetical protein